MDQSLYFGAIGHTVSVILGAGGILALRLGYQLFKRGIDFQMEMTRNSLRSPTHADRSAIEAKIGTAEFRATSVGAVVMATACVWAFLAYMSIPKYKNDGTTTEVVDAKALKEIFHYTGHGTQIVADGDYDYDYGYDYSDRANRSTYTYDQFGRLAAVRHYRVEGDDETPNAVADKLDVAAGALAEVNGLDGPNARLAKGTVLLIPTLETPFRLKLNEPR